MSTGMKTRTDWQWMICASCGQDRRVELGMPGAPWVKHNRWSPAAKMMKPCPSAGKPSMK